MTRIVVSVCGGVVTGVYCTDEKAQAEIVDFDELFEEGKDGDDCDEALDKAADGMTCVW